jgi:hypothetical protein
MLPITQQSNYAMLQFYVAHCKFYMGEENITLRNNGIPNKHTNTDHRLRDLARISVILIRDRYQPFAALAFHCRA